jgi:DNA-binding NarL/FixJ family response regulator
MRPTMSNPATTTSDDSIRVVVSEDSYLLREGLVQALSDGPRVEVVAAAADFDAALEAVERTSPDVVVTDIRMPPSQTDEGIRLSARLAETHPDVGVVVLSQHAHLNYARTLFETPGSRRGYILKDRVADKTYLLDAVTSVARGIPILDPRVVEMLVAPSSAPDTAVGRLTGREREILALIASGATNGMIAQELVLTTRAVEKHVNSIFGKLDLPDGLDHNRRVLAALAFATNEA